MFPILFEQGSVKIHSYGFFIALGYVAALLLGRSLAKSRGLDPAPFMDVGFIAIVSGVIGARLVFILQNPARFLARPAEILDVWNGGLVFYGGFIFAALTCLLYGYRKKMPLALGMDIAVICLAFAHALGRMGCFAAGCCHGHYCPYPWGVHNNTEFVDPALRGQPLHPVQLYESFSLLLLGITLLWAFRRRPASGVVTIAYLMGYAAIRFVMEIFRGDSERGFLLGGWLSLSQGIALALFALGGGFLIRRLRGKNL